MSMWKKLIASLIAIALIVGSGTTAMAAKPDWAGKPAAKKHDKKDDDKGRKKDSFNGIEITINGKKIKMTFNDVRAESAWALEYIAELVKRGVFTGYEDGSFRPNQKVTRIEAITAAVRLMGLRAKAESAEEMSTKLNFKDADKIEKKYPWAVGYVAVAVENDLFLETDNSVQPEKNGDRLWATILLVKALGLEDEAKAKMNVELPFKDKKEIPAGSVGYVAVAMDKGLVTGYENNTFRPNQPVTRAELAALLERTGEQIPDTNTGFGEVTGTYAGLSNGKMTITKDGQTASFAVSQDVAIVRNNALVDLEDLLLGDNVKAVVSNGMIIYITVTKSVASVDGQKSGTVTAVGNGKLSLKKDGTTTTYSVKNDVVVVRNNVVTKLSSVKAGDQVNLVVAGGVVIHISVTTPVAENGQVSGVVSAVYGQEIDMIVSGGVAKYNVDAKATIVRNGHVVELAAVQPGDEVDVAVVNSNALFITVTKPVSDTNVGAYTVEGTYQGHKIEKGKLVQISITTQHNKQPITQIYNVASDVNVNGNALSLEKDVSVVELVVVNQVVTMINIK